MHLSGSDRVKHNVPAQGLWRSIPPLFLLRLRGFLHAGKAGVEHRAKRARKFLSRAGHPYKGPLDVQKVVGDGQAVGTRSHTPQEAHMSNRSRPKCGLRVCTLYLYTNPSSQLFASRTLFTNVEILEKSFTGDNRELLKRVGFHMKYIFHQPKGRHPSYLSPVEVWQLRRTAFSGGGGGRCPSPRSHTSIHVQNCKNIQDVRRDFKPIDMAMPKGHVTGEINADQLF